MGERERESSTVAFYGSKLPFSLALSTHTYTHTHKEIYIYKIHMYNIAIHSYTV